MLEFVQREKSCHVEGKDLCVSTGKLSLKSRANCAIPACVFKNRVGRLTKK